MKDPPAPEARSSRPASKYCTADAYSNSLILVVDDLTKGRAVSEAWSHEQAKGDNNETA